MCFVCFFYETNKILHNYNFIFFSVFVEHSVPTDIDKLNREIIEQDYNLWDALESSKWIPCDTLELCY